MPERPRSVASPSSSSRATVALAADVRAPARSAIRFMISARPASSRATRRAISARAACSRAASSAISTIAESSSVTPESASRSRSCSTCSETLAAARWISTRSPRSPTTRRRRTSIHAATPEGARARRGRSPTATAGSSARRRVSRSSRSSSRTSTGALAPAISAGSRPRTPAAALDARRTVRSGATTISTSEDMSASPRASATGPSPTAPSPPLRLVSLMLRPALWTRPRAVPSHPTAPRPDRRSGDAWAAYRRPRYRP